MAFVTLSGRGMLWPEALAFTAEAGGNTSSTMVIDAGTELAAFAGQVWWAGDDDAKDLTKIHIPLGAVTLDGASSFRCSCQDVALAAGPPIQPDAGVDESVSVSSLSANALNTFTLGANRTMNRGGLLAVVFDYVTFTAGDSVTFPGFLDAGTSTLQPLRGVSLLNTGSWALQRLTPALVLEFTDGTFGTLSGSLPFVTVNARAFNSGSTSSGGLAAGDERGLEFTPEFPMKVDGGWVVVSPAASADFDIVLYEGDTAMTNGTVSVDSNAIASAGAVRHFAFTFPRVLELSTANTYRLVLKPTTANSVTLRTVTLGAAGHRVCYHGTNASGNSRVDAGAWGTTVTTELPFIGLHVVAVHDGAGGGAAGRSVPRGVAY